MAAKRRQTRQRNVALLIEASRGYARGLVRGVGRYNAEHQEWMLTYSPSGLGDSLASWLRQWNGDGILARITDKTMAKIVARMKVPVVELRRIYGDVGATCMGPDDKAVAQLAFEHLHKSGFRQFAFFGMALGEHEPFDIRAEQFQQIVEHEGLPCTVFRTRHCTGDVWSQERRRILRWIGSVAKPVGVLACNDDYGVQLLNFCRHAEIDVPEEMAVVGVGNDECLCDLARPPMTSIDLDAPRVGYEAAALLDRLMDGQQAPSRHIVVPPRSVVVRKSSDVLAMEDDQIVRAIEYLRENACNSIQVSDVARHAYMSSAALERRVRAVLGRTVHAEIQRIRINRVKDLLTTTDLPIKRIALETGFAYTEYLTRVFREATGQSPSKYREQTRHRGGK